jgi:8-oxo-dGTP pyrophosphatase MutT (NUDIX family)
VDDNLRRRVQRNLAGFEPVRLDAPDYRHAAVGIVLLDDPAGQACFVLTLRHAGLRRHAGQYALPGGRLDPGETPRQAVLREIHEEIGLVLGPEAVLGELDDFATRSGHLITPLAVWAGPGAPLASNPDEVEAAFRVPLAELDRADNPRLSPLIHFALRDHTVYAPTAAILYQFREVALHGRPTRVAHFEQPLFAWR